jgi:hypothetical protein
MKDRCKRPNQLKKPPLKRSSSHVYASSHKRLQQKLAELLGEVEEAERELARHTERQRCLLDLVLHQELVIELLHGDFMSVVAVQAGQDVSLSRAWAAADVATAPALNAVQGSSDIQQCTAGAAMQPLQGSGMLSSTAQPMLTNSAASSPLQQQQQLQQQEQQQQQQLQQLAGDAQMPEAACPVITNSTAATAVGSSSSSSELIARSYTAELLRTATPEDLYSVANMTTQGWHEQFYALFLRLVVLLELVNRNSAEAAQDAAGVTATGSTAAAAAATGALVPDTAAAAAAAAGISAAEPAAAAAASPEFLRQLVSSGPHGTLAQMQATVDVHVRRVVIAYMFNHVPLLEACTADYATRQPSIPPPGHWQVSRS